MFDFPHAPVQGLYKSAILFDIPLVVPYFVSSASVFHLLRLLFLAIIHVINFIPSPSPVLSLRLYISIIFRLFVRLSFSLPFFLAMGGLIYLILFYKKVSICVHKQPVYLSVLSEELVNKD